MLRVHVKKRVRCTHIQAMILPILQKGEMFRLHTYRSTAKDRETNSLKWQEVSNKQQMFTSHTCMGIEIGPTEFQAHSFGYRTTFLFHYNKRKQANVTAIRVDKF